MIRGYDQYHSLPPEAEGHFQWPAALKAGLAVGALFLLFARGNPWAGLTGSTPVVMGRIMPLDLGLPLMLVWLIHLALSAAYAFIIGLFVMRLSKWRAILTGGAVGIGLYAINRIIVHFFLPELEGNEAGVLFTHIVFGLVAAGAYRGLLRRQAPATG